MIRRSFLFAASALVLATGIAPAQARDAWTKTQANAWYDKQPWMVGANYNPRTAINQFEMWQADTFDPKTIDQELGWANAIGMNVMRVYLHNMPWEEDPEGLKRRMDQFLAIADKHKVRIMFVLFDSCWDPDPVSGRQRPPIPGVHNSGWMQAPGAARLADKSQYDKLLAYVTDVVGHFRNDKRIVAWDVWNEANNEGGGNYKPTPRKKELVAGLLGRVFDAAYAVDPTQPLTSGVWIGENWDKRETRRRREDPDRSFGSDELPRLQLARAVGTPREADAELWPPGFVHRIYGARQRLDLRRLAAARQEIQYRDDQLGLRRRQVADASAVGQLEEALHL
ncbi:endo-1,4-beta-xylanase [Sphingomonas sp. 7/4-4]|uniref:endo-1,4-beta-xylanase n=1 Tax=Sphingomonas sp. 7/4-4 TaxID=3018446 RepID=UPI00300DC74D